MKKLLYIILSIITVFSCKHRDEEFEGPDLNDLNGPFYIVSPLQLSAESIDFSSGDQLIIGAELSKRTSWEVEIVGMTSGAKIIITGSDRLLDAETASWSGGADNFPGFGMETASITLSFPDEGEEYTMMDSVQITGLKNDEGFLITSFEEGFGSTWERFNQTTVAGDIKCGDGNAAKGNCYYSWNGTVGWDWAIGSVMVKPESGTFGLPNVAGNLFFNMAIKPIENVGTESSFIMFWFDEDDNGDGVFDEATEDRFVYEYWTEDTEWTLFSHNYSDLQFDAEGAQVETNGNGLPEPSKLVSINVFFLANPNNGNASALVDHMIFTQNEPYKP